METSLRQDLKALTRMEAALWADASRAPRSLLETVTAISLMDVAPERLAERASLALLTAAERDGVAAIRSGVHHPFFRLLPEERLVLVALQLARWSYARLARALDREPDAIASIAWAARVNLATSAGLQQKVPFPLSGRQLGQSCPEYDTARPWTQRFLDEELTARERIFFQGHLMACDSCRSALARCRDFFFALDPLLPRAREEEERADLLEGALRRVRDFKSPTRRSFLESLEIHLRRPRVQWVVLSGLLLVLAALLRR